MRTRTIDTPELPVFEMGLSSKRWLGIAMLALGLCSPAPAQTVPRFSTFQLAPSGLGVSSPTFPAVGDFNADGIPDIVVGDAASQTVNLLLGHGGGKFQAPRLFAVGTNPQCAAVGDFNGDGKLDVVVANGDAAGTISLLHGNGDGTLQPAISVRVMPNPNWVAVGDFNGDGKPDIVVTGNNNFMILLNNGLGGFSVSKPVTIQPPDTSIPSPTLPVVVRDLDGDGKQDLILTGPLANTLFLAGNGNGTFSSPLAIAPASPSPAAIGDFNGDGRPDVAITTAGNPRSSKAAQLWVDLNKGARTFSLSLVGGFPAPSGADNIVVGNPVVADFNGDGKLDIVVKDPDVNVFLFLGNGNGTWQQAGVQGQMPGDLRALLVTADFDRNGSPDLLQPEASNLAVLRNTRGNAPLLTLLTLNPAVAQKGVAPAQGTVFLGSAAPASGAIVTLGISDLKAASLSAPSVIVPPGLASFTFPIFANPVAAHTNVTVSATYNGITLAATLTVLPVPPPLAFTSLTLNKPGIFGSALATPFNFATGTVTLNAPSGAAIPVTLTSSNPALAVFSSSKVTVGPGQTSTFFTISATHPVAKDTPVTILASCQGATRTMTLTILAPKDSVAINKAEYDSRKAVIQVEANSTIQSARLGVWDAATNRFLFWLNPSGGGKSSIQIPFPSAQYPFPVPAHITVRSSLGGIQSTSVNVK